MEIRLEVGKVYRVSHNRKGVFEMRIKHQCDEWVTGFVTCTREGGRVYPNEDVTVRRSFCEFKLIEP